MKIPSIGFTRLCVFDLATLSLNMTAPADFSVPGTLSWSPAGESMAYATRSPDVSGAEVDDVWLVDAMTGQRVLIGHGVSPTWLPDGSQIAILAGPPFPASEVSLKIISVPKLTTEQTLAGSWLSRLDSYSWRPTDGLLTVASSLDPLGSDIKTQKVLGVDVKLQRVTEFRAQTALSILSNPRWSFDGNLLAVNARPNYLFSATPLNGV